MRKPAGPADRPGRGLELCRRRSRCRRTRGARPRVEPTGRGRVHASAPTGRPAGAGRPRRWTVSGGGGGGALSSSHPARRRWASGFGAALPFAVARPALAEAGAIAKPWPVAIAGTIAVPRGLRREWRGRRRDRPLGRSTARGRTVRQDRHPPIGLLALAFRSNARLLLERDVHDPP